jgi:hypothetical protein
MPLIVPARGRDLLAVPLERVGTHPESWALPWAPGTIDNGGNVTFRRAWILREANQPDQECPMERPARGSRCP